MTFQLKISQPVIRVIRNVYANFFLIFRVGNKPVRDRRTEKLTRNTQN